MIDKNKITQALIEELKREFKTLADGATEAREAAISEESKPENKYDTRSLEASYLAGAQAKRAKELRQIITQFEKLVPKTFQEGDWIESTALIHVLIDDNEKRWFFLTAQKGGMRVMVDGQMIYTLSLNSPLGRKFVKKMSGDEVEFEAGGSLRVYSIEGVY
ncbi:MAG: hypothetical protein CL677_03210 [Bdellovibrionaceae bacterium]|nr:hypothetical protein [Pseudobdellovibrionaceae bacterium]|tara:strand:- start:249291 stop:249776 length:486 start_codon:yes stop_codon:yes gene_type:complete